MSREELTAAEVKQILGLRPHPREGGWYTRSYESGEMLAASSFPDSRYDGARHTATAIYYLLEPETFSEMHRLRSDEVFHFYLGDPVEMLQLPEGEAGERLVLGSDLRSGERLQAVVPRGVWQGSRLVGSGRWALLGCTVAPGFEFQDYDDIPRSELLARWPEWSELITALTNF